MNDVQTICKHLQDLELELIWGIRGGCLVPININKAKYTLCDSSNDKIENIQLAQLCVLRENSDVEDFPRF